MTAFLKKIGESIGVAIVALVITFGVSYAYSTWVGPTATAPNNNADTPVNVGTSNQIKSGALGVDSLAVYGDGAFSGYAQVGETGITCDASNQGTLRIDKKTKCLQLCVNQDWQNASCAQ